MQAANCTLSGFGWAIGSAFGVGASAVLAAGAEDGAVRRITPPADNPAITAKGTIVEDSKVVLRVRIISSSNKFRRTGVSLPLVGGNAGIKLSHVSVRSLMLALRRKATELPDS